MQISTDQKQQNPKGCICIKAPESIAQGTSQKRGHKEDKTQNNREHVV